MADLICNYLGNAVLQQYVKDANPWLACHVADPGVLGSIATEVSGAGNDYVRRQASWSTPGSKTIGNTTLINFANLPDCTVTHFALWTAQAGGYCLMTLELPVPIVCEEGDDIRIPANDLAFQL